MFESFDDVRDDLTRRLVRAPKDRKSPMHTPVVVTSDVDARVMVLRAFDREPWSLRFHTDMRAPKVYATKKDPRASVLFYDKGAKIQIRCKGLARIEQSSETAQAAWDKGSNFARRCYLGDGPGTASDTPTSGLPSAFEGVEPTDEQLIPARENFSVLILDLLELDWLYLAHTGHVRAQFWRDNIDDTAEWSARWVSP